MKLNTPSIGGLRLENPFVLAPMAGIGDPPYRRLCRQGGAGLVCAEMVSANALHYGDEKSQRMLQIFPDEHPVSMQIFGAEPERLAGAARKAEEAGADVVDLNCGCPVPKVSKTGAGVSLMREESLFVRCLSSMVKAVKVPVTVKMRLGFTRGENRATRFAKLAEEAGVAAVSVHARAQEDRHDGPPDLAALADVVAAVKIPVFGNGGVNNFADAKHMMESTGCAGVLVGQAAVGNPFLFLEFLAQAQDAGAQNHVPLTLRLDLLRRHARMIADYYGERTGVRRLRKYLPDYVRGLTGAAHFRERAFRQDTVAGLLALVDDLERGLAGKDATYSVVDTPPPL